MKIHKTNTVPQEKCKCTMYREYEKVQNEAKILRRELEQCRNKMKTLEEYHACSKAKYSYPSSSAKQP